MRQLVQIREELNAIHSQIARWDRRLASPDVPASAILNAKSLRKRASQLEDELIAAAGEASTDVCAYRIFCGDESQPQLAAIAKSLGAFQSALSTVFDAITNEPKVRARVSAESARKSSLEFGYSFAGSAGFVFTIPDERMLFEGMATDLDASIDLMFKVIASKTPEEVGGFIPQIGHGGMRAVQSWVKSHAATGTGADVDWRRGPDVIASAFMQYSDWRYLEGVIDSTSEEQTEEIKLVGDLWAANLKSKTFMMHFEGGGEIRGSFGDAIGEHHHAELPRRYQASFQKTTKIHYSLQEDEVAYFLTKLEEAE